MPTRDRAQRWLQDIWYGGARSPLTLRGAAALYGAAMRLRASAFRAGLLSSHGSGRPLIVVGNLTVGGSGKTPLVIWICEQLRELGVQPGIVLRGYGGDAARTGTVHRVDTSSDPAVVGDEALMLAQRTGAPVVVGRDRVAAAREVARAGAGAIVSDDGLQHLRLARDVELVVVDAARGFGNGRLLPAGPLRESVARLATVQAIVLNGDAGPAVPDRPDLPAGVAPVSIGQGSGAPRFQMQLRGEQLLALDGMRSLPLASLRGQRVHAVAGIGHPQRFFRQLHSAGLAPIEHPFADHHAYRRGELTFGDELPVLMTEKDAVKCRPLGLHEAWYLPVSASFPAPQAAQLRDILRAAVMR